MICVHGSADPDECAYCPPRLRTRCEACTDGLCSQCNRASWCDCECDGEIDGTEPPLNDPYDDAARERQDEIGAFNPAPRRNDAP